MCSEYFIRDLLRNPEKMSDKEKNRNPKPPKNKRKEKNETLNPPEKIGGRAKIAGTFSTGFC